MKLYLTTVITENDMCYDLGIFTDLVVAIRSICKTKKDNNGKIIDKWSRFSRNETNKHIRYYYAEGSYKTQAIVSELIVNEFYPIKTKRKY